MAGRSLFDKVWDAHIVRPETDDTPAILYIDLHLLHEVTTPQAFDVLRARGLPVRRTDLCLATLDHSTPTEPVAKLADLRVVINGAGAAGIACGKLYIQLGVSPGNLVMLDSGGVIYRGRSAGMNPYKQALARDTTARTLVDAATDADMIVGLSVRGAFTPDLLRRMRPAPIVFALANPEVDSPHGSHIAVPGFIGNGQVLHRQQRGFSVSRLTCIHFAIQCDY